MVGLLAKLNDYAFPNAGGRSVAKMVIIFYQHYSCGDSSDFHGIPDYSLP